MAWNNPQDEQHGSARKPQGRGPWPQWLRGWRSGRGGSGFARRLTGLLAAALLATLVLGSYYNVDPSERGLVQRFGRLVRITQPGAHLRLPWPIETVERVNVGADAALPLRARLLTADLGLVDVVAEVKYRYSDPLKAVFAIRDPVATLGDASLGAMRMAIGRAQLTPLLGGQVRGGVAETVRADIQRTLDRYDAGVHVTSVTFTGLQVPEPVSAAWRDVAAADDGGRRAAAEAQTYSNEILPRAKSEAIRQVQDAQNYRQQVLAAATGDADRFAQLAAQYAAAPELTRNRLYVETMEAIYARSRKVVIDGHAAGNMLYLPLDKLAQLNGATLAPAGASVSVEPVPEPAARAASQATPAAPGAPALETRGAGGETR